MQSSALTRLRALNALVADSQSYIAAQQVICCFCNTICGGTCTGDGTGYTGPAGPAGTATNTGATGATGLQGPTGPEGTATNTGATGPTGVTGATGFTGVTGATGQTGQTGSTGFTGVTGPTGAQGPISYYIFEGGNPASEYTVGPAFDCGAIAPGDFQIQFQFRRGLAADWTYYNPLLANGEMGLEIDTQLFKIGDGSRRWINLPYGGFTGPSGSTGPTGEVGTGPTGPTGFTLPVQGPGTGSILLENSDNQNIYTSSKLQILNTGTNQYIQVSADIIPTGTDIHNIGSPDHWFSNAYINTVNVGPHTINLGNGNTIEVGSNGTTVLINGVNTGTIVISGKTDLSANLILPPISSSSVGNGYIIAPDLWVAIQNNPTNLATGWVNVGPVVGPIGPQGIQGIQGVTGFTGYTGPQGISGSALNTGATGSTGPLGPTGPQGIEGSATNTGATGSTGTTGTTGSTGPTGVIGPTGPSGSPGPISYFSFDGGSSSNNYIYGPAFDCGTST